MNSENTHNILVFCVALNGYDRIYQGCIKSQRHYAKQQGYCYRLISHQASVSITASAWVKIPLLIQALEQGYDWVAFIDADCQIKPQTPSLQSLEISGKSLYMADGFSGRINSGVMISKNDPQLHAFLQLIYDNCDKTFPETDWGENGHLIHFAKNWAGIHKLDRRWNNNAEPELQDYIRHYSAGGPMRCLYSGDITEKIWRWVYKLISLFKRHKYLVQSETKAAVYALLQDIN